MDNGLAGGRILEEDSIRGIYIYVGLDDIAQGQAGGCDGDLGVGAGDAGDIRDGDVLDAEGDDQVDRLMRQRDCAGGW